MSSIYHLKTLQRCIRACSPGQHFLGTSIPVVLGSVRNPTLRPILFRSFATKKASKGGKSKSLVEGPEAHLKEIKRLDTDSMLEFLRPRDPKNLKPIKVPGSGGVGDFSLERYDYADAGSVLTPEMQSETDRMINELLLDALKPPDYETNLSVGRELLMQMPHDPEEFFLTRAPSQSNYIKLIRIHTVKALVDEGLTMYRDAIAKGLVPTLHTYTAMISLIGARARAKSSSKSYSPARFSKDVELALKFFEEMVQSGIQPSVATYGALINTCAVLLHPKQAQRILDMMKLDGIQPNKICYTSLIVAYHRSGELEKAFDIFMEMRIKGEEPDLHTYNTMIRIAAEKKNVERALDHFDEIEFFGHTRDTYSFVNAMYACAQRQDFHEKAFELYDTCLAQGYKPNARMLNILLLVCKKSGDFETGEMLMQQFDYFGLEKEECTYNTQIQTISSKLGIPLLRTPSQKSYDKDERIQMAEKVFDEMLQNLENPSRRALNVMLEVYTRARKPDLAENFKSIVFPRYNHEYDYYTYLSMIAMYFRLHQMDKALETFKEMKENAITPDYTVYMLLLNLAKIKKSTFIGVKILKEMCDAGIQADKEVAYPFQEIVESLPGYTHPVPEDPQRQGNWADKIGIGVVTKAKQREMQAKKQRKMMLEKAPSPLERYRVEVANQYNEEMYNPSNPKFEEYYSRRDNFKQDRQVPKREWIEPPKYKMGLLSESEANPDEIGESILSRHEKALKDTRNEKGLDKPVPQITAKTKIKLK